MGDVCLAIFKKIKRNQWVKPSAPMREPHLMLRESKHYIDVFIGKLRQNDPHPHTHISMFTQALPNTHPFFLLFPACLRSRSSGRFLSHAQRVGGVPTADQLKAIPVTFIYSKGRYRREDKKKGAFYIHRYKYVEVYVYIEVNSRVCLNV